MKIQLLACATLFARNKNTLSRICKASSLKPPRRHSQDDLGVRHSASASTGKIGGTCMEQGPKLWKRGPGGAQEGPCIMMAVRHQTRMAGCSHCTCARYRLIWCQLHWQGCYCPTLVRTDRFLAPESLTIVGLSIVLFQVWNFATLTVSNTTCSGHRSKGSSVGASALAILVGSFRHRIEK